LEEIAVGCFGASEMHLVAYSLLSFYRQNKKGKEGIHLGLALRQRLQGALGEVLYI
jgi:hypothetical protein